MDLKFPEGTSNKRLADIKEEEAENLAQILSQKYDIPYIDLSIMPISTETLSLVPEDLSRLSEVAAFSKKGKDINVAILTPNNKHLKTALQTIHDNDFTTQLYIASQKSLDLAWERYKEISKTASVTRGVVDIDEKRLLELTVKMASLSDVKKVAGDATKSGTPENITRVLEVMIAGALATKASDIHIEPEDKSVRLRLRLDGVLSDTTYFPHKSYKFLNSRIKLVSGLKLNLKNIAQDGRFSIRIEGREIEIRTSVLPGNYGETIVMRVLDPQTVALSTENLGMSDAVLSIMKQEIKKPHGMILNTGPTGSGKTTTLYSLLSMVNEPGIKIITIEDPIEYHLPGIVQTQVKKGYQFFDGLRSTLRQDPDIIMVGEIRDSDTAKTAIHAALTGHLVFSTLHTNNAAGVIPRLIDLGVDTGVLPDALSIMMAQRLIRKLCDKCKKVYKPDAPELTLVKQIFSTIPSAVAKSVEKPENAVFYKAVGCKECNNTGYKGRLGIFEIIQVDENVEKIIVENPSERTIWQAAKSQEIPRMTGDGILKVLAGVTDITELSRVVDLSQKYN
jgi:type II secretory ATPase GspE/PulE/Tfp pilus assembly ATPase PilB-like protein